MAKRRGASLGVALVLLGSSPGVWGQRLNGEIRLTVKDQSGRPLVVSGLLESQSTEVRRTFETDAEGMHAIRSLPFGPYRLMVEKAGFQTVTAVVDVRSAAPVVKEVVLGVAGVETTVTVRAEETLSDPRRISANQFVGADNLQYRPSSLPGRSVLDQVNMQPGWLLEANGILHPRASEYDVQYVLDGMPLYDNRSPAFAQSLGVEEFESMNVRTAGYPAEFGRKLGGVIEVTTPRDDTPGWHGRLSMLGGSFSQASSFGAVTYSRGANSIGVSGEGMSTDRYLDPPVVENYTNHGSGGGGSLRFERKWSGADSTRFYVSSRHTGFQAPNELLQQAAGQRQDRTSDETLGHVSHTHLFSPGVVSQFRAMVRDTSADLWGNPLSTPILPFQDRGFREGYVGGNVSVGKGSHEFKAGVEALFSSIQEDFRFHITTHELEPWDVEVFDDDVPEDFAFRQRRRGRDQSAYVQDQWRKGNFTASAGLRLDHYSLAVDETAWSPRLGAAYAFPSKGLVLRASYDRIFQVPAIENILLASTNLVEELGGEGAFLPLKGSRGNFLEAGFSQSLFSKIRLDGTWYRRKMSNFADDSLLLNTGVSFPIAFAEAEVHGFEAKLDVPGWGPFAGFVSYSNMVAKAALPLAGGLLLGDEAEEGLEGQGSIPLTQDQRNTLRARVRVQPRRRFWFMVNGAYNSGLPFELEGPANEEFTAAQYGTAILSKVNYERGRVRPSASIGVSGGVELSQSERLRLRLQGDVFNLCDRLNVINFSGLLSGTAVEPGRNFALRLNADF